MKSTAHVWRAFALVVVATVVGLVAQRLLRPSSFGDLGHFRAASLSEIAGATPVYQGEAVCAECHGEIFDIHGKDVHYGVQCEDCHGPGDVHVRFYRRTEKSSVEGGGTVEAAAMPKEYTLEGCLYCHRKLAARPLDFPQIDPVQHYSFLNVTDPATRCVECHSPHEPLFLLTKASEARLHPVIFECTDCHEGTPEESHKDVEGHPVIFVCADCHGAVVEDFADREHAFLRCTACHLYHRETEVAGRIYKNGNRRFCLLCHEQKPFKAQDATPLIVPSEHLGAMAEILRKDAKVLEEDPRACLTCHIEYIHDPEVIGAEGEADEESTEE